MRQRSTRILFRFALPAVLALTVFAYGGPQATVPRATPAHSQNRGPATPSFLLRYAIPGTNELQLIIELTDPPVARAMAAVAPGSAAPAGIGRSRPNLNSPQAIAYQAQIERAQRLVTERLNTLSGVQVQGSTKQVMNAIIARVPIEHYLAVRGLPGVKKVYFSRPRRKNLNTSAVLLNAPALWTLAGGRSNAGHGVRIGLIDTGIDVTNPMFIDSTTPLPAGFPMGELALTNHKVIVARNFLSFLNPQRVRTAVDEDGHGTFVAGCAAGKLVNAPLAQISGMAPGAFLGNYKVFGTPGINDTTNDGAILAAIDAAITDGMDVLNMSLGSLDFLPPSEDPEVTAINTAIASGIVVVLAAGNDGPNTHTIGSPGAAPDAIAVGAVSNSRLFASQLHVTGPGVVPQNLQNIAYENGTGPVIATAIPATPVTDVATLDSTGTACSALPAGSLTSSIAFIERGQCLFSVKVGNAANAGARAVIVYDNIQGESPITMAGLESTTIPSVMISNADGLAVKSFVGGNPGATISIDVSTSIVAAPTAADVLTDFSSRGPSTDFGIKPDLVAVGDNVYSATQNLFPNQGQYDASHFTSAGGTSFSTPMVSGAAAAVMQLFPSLAPAAIKSALANTANQNVTIDGTTPATIVQAGNGLLDMGKAAAVTAVFSPTNLNFGVQAYSDSISLTRTLVITNISGSSDQYTFSVRPVISGPAISLSAASTGPVAPGGSTSVDVSVQATAPLSGGFQGFIAIQSGQTSATYTIPYWAGIYVPDSSRILTVAQGSTAAGVFSNLSDAIAAANPGNIIEIADSQTYTVGANGFTISTNAQGLPLHGLTIRAAAGQTPVLDGTTTAAHSDIAIIGLRNVLLQGLTINGGETGVDILQPSPTVPLSVTIDHCTLTNQTATSTSAGIFVESGGDVDITYTTISGSSSAGVAAMGGATLTMSNSTVQSSASFSIDSTLYPATAVFGLDSNVDLINSTVSGNAGVGAYLENCSGTLNKNVFGSNTGVFGDGVEVGDGTVTVSGNTFDTNDAAGIYLFSVSSQGPKALIEKNIIQSNAGWGVWSDQSLDLRLTGNLIKDNGLGFLARGATVALLVNNIVVRSVDPTQANGVDVGGSSSVNIVNNTIYKNLLHGIALSAGATLSVSNTIISQNTGGDLLGLTSNNIQFSLIGDGTLSGGTNRSGDPQFTLQTPDDFSLAPGSPAIDAGSNAAANLPFLDYNQQLRVASTGALPGGGLVDMGALEAGSSYPLNYQLLLSGNNSTLATDFITGFAALNPSTSDAAQATFSAYDPAGNLIGQTNPPIPFAPESQTAILDYQLFGFPRGASKLGAVLASSAQKLVGFFLIFDQDFSQVADGVDVSADTATDFFLMRHESDTAAQTIYQLFNPGVNPASITATLLDSSGVQLDTPKTSTVAPKGQFMFSFNAVTASSGYVHVQSDRPVTGMEVFGNASEVGALRATPAGTETRLFFPHIAVNQGYTSQLGIVNPSSSTATVTLTAYANDGSVLGTPAVRSVNANGQLLESATTLFGLDLVDQLSGYVVAVSDQIGITGFCAFDYDNGAVHSSAAVPAESVPQQELLFSHVAHQFPAAAGDTYLTGIALLNPFGTQISYTMRIFDSFGNQVAQKTDVLGPHEKVAKLLSWPDPGAGFFTQPLSLGGGHIEVTTDYQLLGFELFFTQRLTLLSAVMAQFPN